MEEKTKGLWCKCLYNTIFKNNNVYVQTFRSYIRLFSVVSLNILYIVKKYKKKGGVPLAYNPDCQQPRLPTTFCLQLRLPTFPIANRAIAYKQLLRTFKDLNINIHIAHMTLLRTDTLHTWHYCAHTHCTHDIIAHIHIAHMTLLRTYTLHTWY